MHNRIILRNYSNKIFQHLGHPTDKVDLFMMVLMNPEPVIFGLLTRPSYQLLKDHIVLLSYSVSTLFSFFVSCLAYFEVHRTESYLRRCYSFSWSRVLQLFMESDDSLPCSQKLANGPDSEPNESSSHPHIIYRISEKECTLFKHFC
jgi:hypothetical protein